jgi:hypothetical protein
MIPPEVCHKCGTKVSDGFGIGPYCPNHECDVKDNLLQAEAVKASDYDALLAEVDRLTKAGNYYAEQIERLRSQFANSEREVETLRAAVEAYETDAVAYRKRVGELCERVEKLKGELAFQMQAGLEEKAEAWGEVERLRALLLQIQEESQPRGEDDWTAAVYPTALYVRICATLDLPDPTRASPSPRTVQEG